ncbi:MULTISPECIES: CHAT domain-containing protein [Streptomyces]|uniref:CHAT domain-containing protein n=1 Tax=Streptomyces TaxID=1883 RepID=UPI0004AB96AC|nr:MULTISPECIES: CHAT domain-containing protein [Streptomyces]
MVWNYAERVGALAGPGAMSGNFTELTAQAAEDRLARGVLLALAGASMAAHTLLLEVARERPDQAGPALAWAHLAALDRVKALPGGSSAGVSTELADRLPPGYRLRDRWQEAMAAQSTITFAERLALTELPSVHTALGYAEVIQQAAARKLKVVRPPMGAYLARNIERHYHLTSHFRRSERACLARICARLRLARGEQAAAEEWLELGRQAAAHDADHAGVAATHVLLGDHLLAPRTGPDRLDTWTLDQSILGRTHALSSDAPSPDEWERRSELAEEQYAKAEQVLRRTGSPLPRAWAMLNLRRAQLCLVVGRFSESAGLADSAAEGFDEAGDERNLQTARIHRTLAEIHDERVPALGDVADELADWGLGRGSLSHALGLAMTVGNVGNASAAGGHYGVGIRCYQLVRETCRGLGLDQRAIYSTVTLARLYQDVGDLRTARSYLVNAEAELDDRSAPGGLEARRTAAERIELLDVAQQLATTLKDGETAAATADRIAQVLASPQGKRLPRYARQSAGAVIAQSRSSASMLQALEAERDSRPDDAADGYRTALTHAGHRSSGRSHRLATVLLAKGELEQARQAMGGLDLGGRPTFGTPRPFPLLHLLGRGLLREHRRVITDHYELMMSVFLEDWKRAESQAAELERRHGPRWWERMTSPQEALIAAGEIAEHRHDPETALTHYREAMSRIERIRGQLRGDELRTSFADSGSASTLYFAAARTLLAAADRDEGVAAALRAESFTTAEHGRARGLYDLLPPRGEDGQPLPFPAEAAEWRRLSAHAALDRHRLSSHVGPPSRDMESRYHELRRTAAATERRLGRVERGIRTRHPELWHALHPAHEPPTLGEAQRALGPDTLAVAYAVKPHELLLWAFDRDSLRTARQVATERWQTARAVQSARRCWERREDRFAAAPEALARLVLDPVGADLDRYRRVVFIPSGPLHDVPFSALPWHGLPLGERLTVTTVPSAGVLTGLPSAGPVRLDRLLAVGDPRHLAQGRLPWARREALFAASLAARPTVLLGDQATRKAVRSAAEDVDVVHLAAHGEFDRGLPLASAVLLAGTDRLTAADLVGLRLHDALVVASACHTGQGWQRPGEDVQGLTRGILAAGAGAAVVSLWRVPDAVTAVLMAAFHRALRDGQDAPTALRSAQSELRAHSPESFACSMTELATREQQFADAHGLPRTDLTDPGLPNEVSHPYYWGAFTCVARQ